MYLIKMEHNMYYYNCQLLNCLAFTSPETKMQGPRVKDEKKMNSSTAANDGAQVTAKAMISIIQDQQDQLMKLLQSVSNERDSFKEKVKELHAQLEVEKQCADCQTAREKARLHLKVC